MTIENGGPAFPSDHHGGEPVAPQRGMSLRDWFAGQAIRGFNSEMVKYEWGENVLDKAATMAYRVADAMIKARGV